MGGWNKRLRRSCSLARTGPTPVPVAQLGFLMLGPGTSVTHAAMNVLAQNNCLIFWTGEGGGPHLCAGRWWNLQRQAAAASGRPMGAIRTAASMLRKGCSQKRFSEPIPANATFDTLRGLEGARVRRIYKELAEKYGVNWKGRRYDQGRWDYADPVNRALSAANSLLYGVCYSAIVSAGYSPAIGFIHTGKMLSFVYDVADLYKTDSEHSGGF